MKKKKQKLPEVFKPGDKVRVKNSYYTFSKEYPKASVTGKKKRRRTKKATLRTLLAGLLFISIALLSFFAVDLGLKISYAPIGSTEESRTPELEDNKLIREQGLRALYMPYSKLGDEEYIRELIKDISRHDANSVVIEFKTPEGKLCYSSLNDYAIAGKASIFDNDTLRRAISIFAEKGVTVAAKISCFRDPAVAQAVPELAVKYMGTDVNWLDGSDEKGGKPWLNPCSSNAAKYLLGIIGDLRDFGINCFILSDVQFPSSNSTAEATYPFEKNKNNRNALLKTFIEKVKAKGDENTLIFLWQSATDALDGEDIYFGSLHDSAADGIIYDLAQRPEEYVIDKSTDYVSVLALHGKLKQLSGEKLHCTVTEEEDYTFSYRRALKKNGYETFVLRNEEGVY